MPGSGTGVGVGPGAVPSELEEVVPPGLHDGYEISATVNAPGVGVTGPGVSVAVGPGLAVAVGVEVTGVCDVGGVEVSPPELQQATSSRTGKKTAHTMNKRPFLFGKAGKVPSKCL